ncbi:hypothetical protein [Pseudomonas fulva]|nr:hypothetical protein [Pseudomonas fulva]MBF8778559.1 hypothetical protein [Pseudomonas fulva]
MSANMPSMIATRACCQASFPWLAFKCRATSLQWPAHRDWPAIGSEPVSLAFDETLIGYRQREEQR